MCVYVCVSNLFLKYILKLLTFLNNVKLDLDCLDIHNNTNKETRKFIIIKLFVRLGKFSSFHANKHANSTPNSVRSEVVLHVHGV